MKRAKIYYRKNDEDNFTITRVENVASADEIMQEFGINVSEKYLQEGPCFILEAGCFTFKTKNKEFFNNKPIPCSFTKLGFSEFIALLKASGNRLVNMVKEEKKKEKFEEKEILI